MNLITYFSSMSMLVHLRKNQHFDYQATRIFFALTWRPKPRTLKSNQQRLNGHQQVAITLPCPAEQDLLQLGRTTHCTSSDRMQRNGFQRGDKKALVTPLVTELVDTVSRQHPEP